MLKVVMVSLRCDSKSYMEAKALVENNYEVKLFFKSSEKEPSKKRIADGINFERVYLRSFDAPLFRWFLLFLFWLKALLKLLFESNVDVIHCHDFHTMPIGVILRKIKKAKLVYDAHEFYPASVRNYVPLIVYKLISLIDQFFVAVADCVIIPNIERKIFFPRARKIIVVLNTLEYIEISKKKKNDVFTLFYAGGLAKESGLNFVVKAVQRINEIKFVLAGWGPRSKWLQKLSEGDKFTYLGEISHEEAIRRLSEADATFAFYEPSNENQIYAAPSKLFEAMATGTPIITNKETVAARIVERNQCGLVIPYGDVSKLKETILLLKNNTKLRDKLGKNGRYEFKTNLDWNILKHSFVKAYDQILR